MQGEHAQIEKPQGAEIALLDIWSGAGEQYSRQVAAVHFLNLIKSGFTVLSSQYYET